MIFRRSTLRLMTKTVLVTAMVATLAACGDPKTPPNAIVVTFDPTYPPPTSLSTGGYAGIAADVANDVRNAGVNFSCVPDTPAGTCGTFTPPGAGSAVPVCYLAPAQVPSGGTVTVTATSVTDATKFISASITILSGAAAPCP
ncbi:MAG TPA: hypothetical protein VIX14_08840 [Terriglobales bacterium]